MPVNRRLVEIVHAGALELRVGPHESAGLDDVGGDAETGAEPQHGAGIRRDIGLEEGKAHERIPKQRDAKVPQPLASRKCLARLDGLIIPKARPRARAEASQA
jgi:hypothetical protein